MYKTLTACALLMVLIGLMLLPAGCVRVGGGDKPLVDVNWNDEPDTRYVEPDSVYYVEPYKEPYPQ